MGNFGAGKMVGIVILVVVLVIVMLASSFFTAVSLVVEKVQEFVNNLSSNIETYGWKRGLQETFGLELTAVSKMSIYYIDDQIVQALKDQLNAMEIDTEVAGLTQVRLKKILLANTVSSSLSNTIVVTPVSEDEILKNLNKKDPEKYNFTTINEFTEYWNNDENSETVKKSKSDDIWPLTSSTDYSLYYESDVFFYFKDEDEIMPKQDEDEIMPKQDEDQWYLAAMGATTIQAVENTGVAIVQRDLKEYSDTEFALLKTNYETNPTQENRSALNGAYRFVDSDHIELYTVSSETNKYVYTLKWGEEDGQSYSKSGPDDPVTTYNIGTQTLSLSQDLDTSAYAIPIELMIDLLNITGSGEFLETFIDYAIDKTKVTVNAYVTDSSTYTYNRTDYQVDTDFIIEIYDMIEGNDWGESNFAALKDIIFNRQYEGAAFDRVTDIEEYKRIDAGLEVSELQSYLKTAYDPGEDFSISQIDGIELVIKEETSQKWDIMPYQVSTWYGDLTYVQPTVEQEFYLPSGKMEDIYLESGEQNTDKVEEFNEFGYNKADFPYEYQRIDVQDPIERKIIYNGLIMDLTSEEASTIGIGNTSLDQDIYDKVLGSIGTGDPYNFENIEVYALGQIAMNDEGEENDNLGNLSGSDYIYTKYTKRNIVQYEGVTKTAIDVLNKTNVSRTNSNIDEKLEEFLELLQNETGNIPILTQPPGSEGGFKSDADGGKVVMYGDIYAGHIPAGDLLLDNGALMLFELLESTESTQGLVNVFKYLAYKYTNTDYGVTSADALIDVFNMNYIGGNTGGSSSGFYWPIGSTTIREENGIKYADGTDVPSTYSPAGYPAYSNGDPHGGHDITPSGYSGDIYIIACADGVVKRADTGYVNREGDKSKSNNDGYGNLIVIEHTNGMTTYYAHLDQVNVTVGQTVKQGQVIGTMGNTGNSTGKHLHFEVRTGSDSSTRVQPLNYVSQSNPRPVAVTSGESQTVTYGGKTIKYDPEFASNTTPPTAEMIEKTIISKTTCYDLCYFCCEKVKSDPEYGLTASGMRLKGGEKIVAADRRVLPMGTWIYIEGVGYYMVADVGGAIKGNRLDIFMGLPGDKVGDASGGTAANPQPGQTCHNAPGSYSRVKTGSNVKVYVLKEEYWPK